MTFPAVMLKRAMLAFVVVLLGFIMIALIVNLSMFDEDIDQEVAAALEPKPVEPEEKNAYFAIMGMRAADDKQITKAGIELMQRYRSNRDERGLDELTKEDYREILGGENLDKIWHNDYKSCRARTEYGCLSDYAKQLTATPLRDKRFALMLYRYQQVLKMPIYQDIQDSTIKTPLPSYGYMFRVSDLHMAQLHQAGDIYGFLQAMSSDMQFWRMVLLRGDTLMSKMIAVAALWRDVQFLSEFIRSTTLSKRESLQVEQLLSPLTQEALDIGEAFAMEQRMLNKVLANIDRETLSSVFQSFNYFIACLYQANATENDHYFYFTKPMMELARLPVKEFVSKYYNNRQEKDREHVSLSTSALKVSPSSIYNFTGKMLVGLIDYHVEDYIARTHDLDGMMRLVRLQLYLMNAPEKSIEIVIRSSGFLHPYSDMPMEWNAAEEWLGFECLSKGSVCKIKVL